MPTPHPPTRRPAVRRGVLLAAMASVAVVAASRPAALPPEWAGVAAPEGAGAGLPDRAAFRARLAAMIDAIRAHHVDEALDAERLVQGAIDGMLGTLDPHTHFLDRKAYKSMREQQDGSFYGLGIIISVRRDGEGRNRLTVISPVDGGPAKRLGVRPGDIIAAIDGTPTDGLQLDEAVSRLRGGKGTTVTITIERVDGTFDLAIERAEIPTESVQHAYMIREDTGFVRVKDFTKTTTSEVRAALGRLRGQGMRQLVLDLRDNPGGLLEEAVSVSGLLLDPGALVVETRGRVAGANESHRAPTDPERLPSDAKLIVLVNRGSASAAEIVAGAVQDHDRGLIVGTTTWGKGLVQSVYSLSEDCGLALTTARYYTPSGRQIQRDYRSSFFDYYYPRPDTKPHGEEHVTDGGRKVFSGGGIEPDVTVDAEELHPVVQRMIQRSLFFRFAGQHAASNPGAVKAGQPLASQTLSDYRAFAETEKLVVTPVEWEEARPQVELHLAVELANAHLGLTEGFRIAAEADAQVKRSLELWNRADRPTILRESRARAEAAAPTEG